MKYSIIFLFIVFVLFSCEEKEAENKPGNSTDNAPMLTYKGAFKTPTGRTQISEDLYATFQSSGAAAAYNPYNNSLFLAARFETKYYNKLYPAIAEISIPEPVTGELADLPEAQIITNYTDCISNVINQIEAAYGHGEGHGIGGLMVYNDYLIGTIYRWHNCGEPLPVSHFYTMRTNYDKSNTSGLLSINAGELNGLTAPAGAMAGYMVQLPSEWQNKLGYKALTGSLFGEEIGGRNNRCSNGTAAFGFNPEEFLSASEIDGEQFMYYSLDYPMDSVFFNKAHNINGMAFIEYSDNGEQKPAIVYGVRYGNPPYFWDSGYRATSYDAKLYFFNPDDLLAVKNGTLKQYELIPYYTINLSQYFYNTECKLKSMTYNPNTKNLYIVEEKANDVYPVVHVFQVQ